MIKVIVNGIVIGIVKAMPLFLSLFCNPILSFFPKSFLRLFFFKIYNMDESVLHNASFILSPSVIIVISYYY